MPHGHGNREIFRGIPESRQDRYPWCFESPVRLIVDNELDRVDPEIFVSREPAISSQSTALYGG